MIVPLVQICPAYLLRTIQYITVEGWTLIYSKIFSCHQMKHTFTTNCSWVLNMREMLRLDPSCFTNPDLHAYTEQLAHGARESKEKGDEIELTVDEMPLLRPNPAGDIQKRSVSWMVCNKVELLFALLLPDIRTPAQDMRELLIEKMK